MVFLNTRLIALAFAGQGYSLVSVAQLLRLLLHVLCYELAHRISRLLLHPGGDMGVGAQCEACVVVPQHTGDRLDVHAVLESQRGEGMPLWHNKDKSETPCIAADWRFIRILFPLKILSKMGVRRGGNKVGLHVKDKFVTM